jgi:AcrR family transcriptional regulator
LSPRAGLDRNTILQTSIELANTQGIEQVTIAAIAKKLGVRSPSLYNHVSGLTEIRIQIALSGMEQLEQILMRAVIGKAGKDSILSFCKSYLTFAKTNPGLYEATIQPAIYPNTSIQKAGDRIIDLLLQILASYQLEKTKALHFVRGLRSIVHGFASLDRAGGFQMELDVEESLLFTVQLLCDGLQELELSE